MIAILIIHNGTHREVYKDNLINLMEVIYKILPTHIDVKFQIISPLIYEKEYNHYKSKNTGHSLH